MWIWGSMLRTFWISICALHLTSAFLCADSRQLKLFSVSDGLPNAPVTAVTQDKQGNLWFGSAGEGAFRYDGKKFTAYKKGKDGLASNFIRTIYRDREGNLWIGTESDGVTKYDGKNFVTYNVKNSSLASNSIKCILQDRKGRYWFGTTDRGVSTLDGAHWENYNKANSNLPDNSIHDMAEDNAGNIWLATHRGVCKFDGRRFSVFDKKSSGLPDDDVNAIVCDDLGQLWLGTENQWIIKFDGRTFIKQNTKGWYGSIRSAYKDSASKLWFGTASGMVITYDGQRFAEVNLAVNLPPVAGRSNLNLRGIYQDSEKNFWFATSAGAIRLDVNPPMVRIDVPEKTAEGEKITITFSGDDGRFGTRPSDLDYSYRVNDGPWSKFSRSSRVALANLPAGAHRLQVQARDKSGNTSRPVERAIVIQKKAPLADKIAPPDTTPPEAYLTRKPPRAGKEKSLRFEFAAKDDRTPKERLTYSHRLAPVENDWSEFSHRSSVDYANLKSGTYVFLLRAKDEANNISSAVVYDFTIERPWPAVAITKNIGKDSAAFEFTAQGMDPNTEGVKFSYRLYPREKEWSEFSKVNRKQYKSLPRGHYLFQVRAKDAAEGLEATGEAPFEITVTEEPKTKITSAIPETLEKDELAIEFIGEDNKTPVEKLKYSYRLLPKDHAWSAPTFERKVTYARLTPGRYIFEVRSIDEDGHTDQEPAQVSFSIRPPEERRTEILNKNEFSQSVTGDRVKFTFSARSTQGLATGMQYSWMLSRIDKGWSEFSTQTVAEYRNLHNGDYTFIVGARDRDGYIYHPDSIAFKVQLPEEPIVSSKNPPREKTVPLSATRGFRSALFSAMALIVAGIVTLRRMRLRRAIRRKANPYIIGKPVHKEDMFFGRDATLAAILDNIHNNSIILHGERRIGKTSLLHQLKKKLAAEKDPQYQFLPVYMDLEGIAGERFFYTIMAELLKECQDRLANPPALRFKEGAASYSVEDLSRDLKNVLGLLSGAVAPKEIKLVLLIDEADQMNEYDRLIHQRFRSLFMDTFAEQIVAIVAGTEIKKKWEGLTSPWYNFFIEMELGPLSEKEAEDLIRKPVSGIYAYEPAAVRRIIAYSEMRPYDIQKYCGLAVERILESKRRTITVEDIDYVRKERMKDEG